MPSQVSFNLADLEVVGHIDPAPPEVLDPPVNPHDLWTFVSSHLKVEVQT
jgi:hypothetical protein